MSSAKSELLSEEKTAGNSTLATKKVPFVSQTAIVVSDDAQVKAMLRRILTPKGWTIQYVIDNLAALKLIEASRFDLIVTGEKTSGQEDVELLRTIRDIHPHTRVIILTDDTTPADVISSMRAHAFAYFSTPFSLESLSASVRQAIEEPTWDDGIEIVSAVPSWIRLIVRCDMKTSERLIQFFCEIIQLPEVEKEAVVLAFRELLMNAIEHGGNFDPDRHVEISYIRTRRAVACKIKDPGEGFSLGEIPHAAIMNPVDNPLRHISYREAENLRPGGLGLLLAKNSIDELLYNEKGNEVVLVKYIDWLRNVPLEGC
jgi:anti-sigma regulatory factor (Ser/Thr protein kinase)/CheY-like chemotaxis protein